ncbi:MAG: Type 1 glutamine amidotransferase-like domain-containing protein [Actinomycetes bacterium]
MRGSLALVGSGEYLPDMAELEKSLIQDGLTHGKANKFVQIPTAAGRESKDRLEFWKELGARQADLIGAEQIFLPIFDRDSANSDQFADAISDSALVYMSGGDPHYLAQTLTGTPVWDAILKNWQSGGSLAGCSAGAMVLSSEIPNFRFLKYGPTPGLNVIGNIRVIPHFNKFFKWIPDAAAKVLMHAPEGSILLGVDEMTALVQRSGKDFWEVNGQAKVHVLQGAPAEQLFAGQLIKF